MAPAVAHNYVDLGGANLTIYYPADQQSDTALAYRNEDLERQQREPSYAPTCFEIKNPNKKRARPVDTDLEANLASQLLEFLGPEHFANKRRALESVSSIASDTELPNRRPLTQLEEYHTRLATNEAARNESYNKAAQLAKINNDRLRNSASPSLAPPNRAMVTRQLHSPSTHNSSQSYGQRPVSEAAYNAATKAAMDARQPGQMAQRGEAGAKQWAIVGNAQASRFTFSPAGSPAVTPRPASANAYAMNRSPSTAPVQQQNAYTRPQNRSSSTGPVQQQNGNAYLMNRSPSTASVQQQNAYARPQGHFSSTAPIHNQNAYALPQSRSPSNASVQQQSAYTRPQSRSPIVGSPSMAAGPKSGSAWSPQPLHATTAVHNQSPRLSISPNSSASLQSGVSPRSHSPQMVPPRIDTPQGSWLGDATARAMQPHAWAKPDPSPPRPLNGAQNAHLSADGRYFVPGAIDQRFLQPTAPIGPARSAEQYQRVQKELEETKRLQAHNEELRRLEQAKRLEADQEAKRKAQAELERRARAGRVSATSLAEQYNVNLAAASQPQRAGPGYHVGSGAMQHRSPVRATSLATSQAQRPAPYHYAGADTTHHQVPAGASQGGINTSSTDTPPQKLPPQFNPGYQPVYNAPFRHEGLNKLFPVSSVQVPIALSEEDVLSLFTYGGEMLRNVLHGCQAQDRRRVLQQFYANNPEKVHEILRGRPQSFVQQQSGRQLPAQQTSRPSHQEHNTLQQRQSYSQHQQQQHGGSTPGKNQLVQRTDMNIARPAGLPSVETPTTSTPAASTPAPPPSRPYPAEPGVNVGTDPIPPSIRNIATAIRALPKTKDGFPVRKALRTVDSDYFGSAGTLLKRNEGGELLKWYLDDRLFSPAEWHWLRYPTARTIANTNSNKEHN